MARKKEYNLEDMALTPPVRVNRVQYEEFKRLMAEHRMTLTEIVRGLIESSIPIFKSSLRKKNTPEQIKVIIESQQFLRIDNKLNRAINVEDKKTLTED